MRINLIELQIYIRHNMDSNLAIIKHSGILPFDFLRESREKDDLHN